MRMKMRAKNEGKQGSRIAQGNLGRRSNRAKSGYDAEHHEAKSEGCDVKVKFFCVVSWVLLMLFALMFLLGCVLKKDKPVRICEPYIVAEGETLWSISENYTKGDKRAWIYDICQMNGIEGSICAGETIYVYEGE